MQFYPIALAALGGKPTTSDSGETATSGLSVCLCAMSAIGPKQCALHMSAFGCKADLALVPEDVTLRFAASPFAPRSRIYIARRSALNIARYITLGRYFSAAIVAFVGVTLVDKSRAQGTPEQRWACTEDAFKFCGNDIPDVPRITACMIKNIKQLSPVCRAQFKQADDAKRMSTGRAPKQRNEQ